MPSVPDRREVIAVYAAGLAQGVALVTFPAASSILTSPDWYDLSRGPVIAIRTVRQPASSRFMHQSTTCPRWGTTTA